MQETDSKVFIGNIPLKSDMEELKKILEAHGKVVAMNMKNGKGFTFAHFETPEIAQKVIKMEDGRIFFGQKLNVRTVVKKGETQERILTAKNPEGEVSKEDTGGGSSKPDQKPADDKTQNKTETQSSGPKPNIGGNSFQNRPPPNIPPPQRGGFERNTLLNTPPFRPQGPPHLPPTHLPPPRHAGHPPIHHSGPLSQNYSAPPPHHQSAPAMPQPPSQPQVPNDVEIICIIKNTRNWAEFIEGRLKNMGLRVDVLFPNPDISLGKVLGNIAMRGVMFGICVTPDNERHRSLTVNVLQGEQEEHRNMPLDEAISFISRRYSTFIEKGENKDKPIAEAEKKDEIRPRQSSIGRGERSAPPSSSLIGSNSSLPKEILTIIGFLTDDRPMSIMEYDRLIRFLASKREACLKEEYGSNIPAHLLVPPVGPNQDPSLKSTQEELQNRIIEILNKKQSLLKSQQPDSSSAAGGSGNCEPAAAAGAPHTTASIAPSLQQAIDSLVKTGPNLLASLVGGGQAQGSSSSGPAGESMAESNGGGQLDRFYASLMDS